MGNNRELKKEEDYRKFINDVSSFISLYEDLTATEKKATEAQLRDLVNTAEMHLRNMYVQMDPQRIKEASYGKSPSKEDILAHADAERSASKKDISRLKDVIQEIEENYDISLPKKAQGFFAPTPQFTDFEKDLASLLVNKMASDQETKDKLLLKISPKQLIMDYSSQDKRKNAIQELLNSEKYQKLDLRIFVGSYLNSDIEKLQQFKIGPKL